MTTIPSRLNDSTYPADPAALTRRPVAASAPAHALRMWCSDPDCESCGDGDGECLEDAEIVNGACRCGTWSCTGFLDLEVMGAFNAHLRMVGAGRTR